MSEVLLLDGPAPAFELPTAEADTRDMAFRRLDIQYNMGIVAVPTVDTLNPKASKQDSGSNNQGGSKHGGGSGKNNSSSGGGSKGGNTGNHGSGGSKGGNSSKR